MWLSQSAVERIRELELALRESVPKGVYDDALARIAELERQNTADRLEHARQLRWYGSMLLRRAGSMPLPPTAEEKAEAVKNEPPPAIPDTVIAQAEAIRAEGLRVDAGAQEIADAIRNQTGYSEQEIAEAAKRSVM